ncbi:MAG: hypothetical protein RDV48_30370 [Candidatus Eremiobacteraeota bacterium]|nr:hypothetical protein [Candidatus Eremiobacteraeota bacterium]
MKHFQAIPHVMLFLLALGSAGFLTASASPGADLHFSTQELKPMPSAVSNAAVLAFKGRILVIGGNDTKGATNLFRAFNPLTGEWSGLPPMPAARYAHMAGIYRGKVYVFGGMAEKNGSPLYVKAVESYDFGRKKWDNEGIIPEGMARSALVAYRGKFYLMGGENDERKALATVYAYDPLGRRWERKRDLPYGVNRHCALTDGQELIIAGGMDEKGTTLSRVISYVAEDDRWKDEPPLINARKNFAAFTLGRAFMVAGGWDEKEGRRTFLDSVEKRETGRTVMNWENAGKLIGGRDGLRAATLRGRAYFLGGFDGTELAARVEEGSWHTRVSHWNINRDLKFHLASYRDSDTLLESRNSRAAKPLAFNPPFMPDITNINLKSIRALGFPLTPRPDPAKFYLKFYEYPMPLDHSLSVRKIAAPLGIFSMARGGDLQHFITEKKHVVVKKGFIAPPSRKFSPRDPYPPLRYAVNPLKAGGKTIEPQDYFDSAIPFSSLYVTPGEGEKAPAGRNEAAKWSAGGVLAFHGEIIALLEQTFTAAAGPEPSKFHYFIDAEEGTASIDTPRTVTVIRVPREPMVFSNWKTLPMPQDPEHVFLSGLLLVFIDRYTVKELESAMGKDSLMHIIKSGKKIYSHVFEVGSVVITKKD